MTSSWPALTRLYQLLYDVFLVSIYKVYWLVLAIAILVSVVGDDCMALDEGVDAAFIRHSPIWRGDCNENFGVPASLQVVLYASIFILSFFYKEDGNTNYLTYGSIYQKIAILLGLVEFINFCSLFSGHYANDGHDSLMNTHNSLFASLTFGGIYMLMVYPTCWVKNEDYIGWTNFDQLERIKGSLAALQIICMMGHFGGWNSWCEDVNSYMSDAEKRYTLWSHGLGCDSEDSDVPVSFFIILYLLAMIFAIAHCIAKFKLWNFVIPCRPESDSEMYAQLSFLAWYGIFTLLILITLMISAGAHRYDSQYITVMVIWANVSFVGIDMMRTLGCQHMKILANQPVAQTVVNDVESAPHEVPQWAPVANVAPVQPQYGGREVSGYAGSVSPVYNNSAPTAPPAYNAPPAYSSASPVYTPQETYNSPPPAQPTSNMAEQLTRLGELRATGVLSEDEFAAAKAKLLQ